ncbi:hypothetical protein ALC57_11419 [Trachymyrmex cornetzi]|uniref:Uncharacterized protein n=1 Tax=Trachymyrmex cornetzi TaxID=471704 RepID=A0A151J2M3_9HYME|nr:hypothetical protein ALC57_11419 [Trachymyrmex cornetzi]
MSLVHNVSSIRYPLKEHYCTELKVEPPYVFVRQQEPVKCHTHGKIRAKCTYLVVIVVSATFF